MGSNLLEIKTKCEKDEGEEPVSPTGQFLSTNTFCLNIIVVLEIEIPFKDSLPIKELFQQILLPVNPRFSSTMVLDKNGVHHWKRVEINLEEHINIPSFPTNLSLETYDNLFNEYLTKITMDELPKDRPLWEVHIIKYATTKACGHCIFKFHHAIGDGYSLMGVLFSCLKRADQPSLPLAFPSLRRRSSKENGSKSSLFSTIYNTACDFGLNVYKSFVADDKTPIRSGNSSVPDLHISTAVFSLDHIKQIKTKLGVTINDVIVSIVFLGTRLYMREIGAVFGNSNSTALVLLNTRMIDTYSSKEEILSTDSKSNWGNRFAFLHLPLSKLSDKSVNAFDFLTGIHKMTNQKKNSLAVYLVGHALELLRKFKGPQAGAKFMYNTVNKTSMALTSVIGPVQKMALVDHPVKGLYFAVTGAPTSLVVTSVTYMDTLRIGVVVEKDFIDAQKLISCMENAFHLIYKDCLDSPPY